MTKSKTTRSLPRLSARSPQFATVLVGPWKEPFVIHQDLLTYHSPFFKAALTGKFKEAEAKIVTLEKDDPLTFELFVHWMYHKALPAEDNTSTELLEEWSREDDEGETKTENLIYLYVLADKYDISALKVVTLNELYSHTNSNADNNLPTCKDITYAFEQLPIGCPLLRFLTDSYCCYSDGDFSSRTAHDFPSAFLDAVLSRYAQYALGNRDLLDSLQLCNYYDHKEDNEKIHCP